jgi:L-alanine-DL-glutamate epimerase-like enolase superfamily enzyme
MPPVIKSVDTHVYTIPTDGPEADGTLNWDSTTMVLAEIAAGGHTGLGYTYCHRSAAALIRSTLAPLITGSSALEIPRLWRKMGDRVRNSGRQGIAAAAISALDIALWDLKARLLDISVLDLLGVFRPAIAAYASGGFTSYSIDRLQKQLAQWVEQGFGMVKMKVGADPGEDLKRVCSARQALGADIELFVDANGAYDRKQALEKAFAFAAQDVTWFEEPVSSDDLEGLRLLRERAPVGMEITAGEYGYDLYYFRRMLQAQAVDVLMCDVSRCQGITGFLKTAAVAQSFGIPLSAHTAPSVHAHLACAAAGVRHIEYFHDHARIEQMFFDGFLQPRQGHLKPDVTRPGLGFELRKSDAERFAV